MLGLNKIYVNYYFKDFSFQAKSYDQRSPNTESSDGSIVTKVT